MARVRSSGSGRWRVACRVAKGVATQKMADLKGKRVTVTLVEKTDRAEAVALGIAEALRAAGALVQPVVGNVEVGDIDVAVEFRSANLWSLICHTTLGAAQLTLGTDPDDPPLFIGRCIAALVMDPDLCEKSGGHYLVGVLAAEYRFTNPQQVQT